MSNKTDLTGYSDQELSLNVMNDEYLYRQFRRCDDASDLRNLCECFEYTQEQFEELVSDLEAEKEEDDY